MYIIEIITRSWIIIIINGINANMQILKTSFQAFALTSQLNEIMKLLPREDDNSNLRIPHIMVRMN